MFPPIPISAARLTPAQMEELQATLDATIPSACTFLTMGAVAFVVPTSSTPYPAAYSGAQLRDAVYDGCGIEQSAAVTDVLFENEVAYGEVRSYCTHYAHRYRTAMPVVEVRFFFFFFFFFAHLLHFSFQHLLHTACRATLLTRCTGTPALPRTVCPGQIFNCCTTRRWMKYCVCVVFATF